MFLFLYVYMIVPSQVGTGIHLRLKARAFVFREGEDDSKLVAYVNMDAGMGSDIVRIKAIEKANELLGKQVFSTVSIYSFYRLITEIF